MTVQQRDLFAWAVEQETRAIQARAYPHAALGQTEAAKQEGMTRAEAGAALLDAEWKQRAYMAVIACAEAMREFVCDDIWQFLAVEDRPPLWPKPRALGPVVLKAAREGFIRRTDRTKLTNNVARHGSPVPVWESLTQVGRDAA
jgi:hypothetical protein